MTDCPVAHISPYIGHQTGQRHLRDQRVDFVVPGDGHELELGEIPHALGDTLADRAGHVVREDVE